MISLTAPAPNDSQTAQLNAALDLLTAASSGLTAGAANVATLQAAYDSAAESAAAAGAAAPNVALPRLGNLLDQVKAAEGALLPQKRAAKAALVASDVAVQALCQGMQQTLENQVADACAPYFLDYTRGQEVGRKSDAAWDFMFRFYNPDRAVESLPASAIITQLTSRITDITNLLADTPVWTFSGTSS